MRAGVVKKVLFWTVALGGLAGLVVVSMAPQPVPVDVETVGRGPLQVTLDHEGKTRVRDRYVISAPLAGRVRRIELKPGDPVRANRTVLATFEPEEPALLDARTRTEAAALVRAAEAAVASAAAECERAKAELEFAEADLARTRALVNEGIAARAALDAAAADARAKREILEAARSAQRAAAHQLVIHLRSPVSGVVLRRLRESEAVIPQGEPLIEVANPADLEIVADFLSADAVQMRPAMPVIIDRWGGGQPIAGRVRRVEPSGFMKISALGVEEQRVNVIVDFDDPAEAWRSLGDEYRVEVRVVTWKGDDLILVRTSSLFRHGDRWAVYVVEDGVAKVRPVEAGHRNGVSAEIFEGLREGERVIAYPSDSVKDGVQVKERAG